MLDQTHSGIDEFLYQNGGTVIGSNGKVALDSPQNVQALTYLKGLMTQGIMKFPAQLDSGWSGQAFGENKAAMAIVGNWVVGRHAVGLPEASSTRPRRCPPGPPAPRPRWPSPTAGASRPRRRTWRARSAS